MKSFSQIKVYLAIHLNKFMNDLGIRMLVLESILNFRTRQFFKYTPIFDLL